MNKLIVADRKELKALIQAEIKLHGFNCDLNHLDVSHVTDMSSMFASFPNSQFNGDISQWDTSNVKNMHAMFHTAKFNNDISLWDTSKVKNMHSMFFESAFNADISKWNTAHVTTMGFMFSNADFNGDISHWDIRSVFDMDYMFKGSRFTDRLDTWQPLMIDDVTKIFDNCETPLPYWANITDQEERNNAIKVYELYSQMKKDLPLNNVEARKIKI